MIGSPWNPFFCQTIPGAATRYDGRRVDSGDPLQFGAFDALAIPQFLETDDGHVLQRDHGLFGTAGHKMNAAAFALAFGDTWGTQAAADILATAFFWWHTTGATYGGGLPRVLYVSDYTGPENRRRYLGAGIDCSDAPLIDDDPPNPNPDWPLSWVMWEADDVPLVMGGSPTNWRTVGGGITPNTWPVWLSAAGFHNTDIPAGSRQQSVVDLNRPFRMSGHTVGGSIEIRPWYRSY